MDRRPLKTIVDLDGGACSGLKGGNIDDFCVQRSAYSSQEHPPTALPPKPVRPKTLQRNISQTLVVEALIKIICDQYEKNEDDAIRLFKTICSQVGQLKFLPGLRTDISPIRHYYQNAFEQLIQAASSSIHGTGSLPNFLSDSTSNSWFNSRNVFLLSSPRIEIDNSLNWNINLLLQSRYKQEFQEIGKIDKGGNGTVYKAKNKIDGCLYAVKKIPLLLDGSPENSSCRQLIKEVECLASLSHPNIVAYKTSWIDYCIEGECNCYGSSDENAFYSSGSTSSVSHRKADKSPYSNQDVSDVDFEESGKINKIPRITLIEDENQVTKDDASLSSSPRGRAYLRSVSYDSSQTSTDLACKDPSYDRALQCRSQLTGTSAVSNYSTCVMGFKSDVNAYSDVRTYGDVKQTKSHVILIIQMELCSITLRQWLDERNSSSENKDHFSIIDEKLAMKIFEAILQGVCYFHKENIIHRDLKPSNIFFNCKDKRPQIGDFGLATITLTTCRKDEKGDHASGYTTQIGTKPYASPEQLESKTYDQKTDMYSLGIILIELLMPFNTFMEKSKFIENMKKGKILPEFAEQWPVQTELIKKLISKKPKHRPSASEILESGLFDETRDIRILKTKIEHLKKEVAKLQTELLSANSEIDRLTTKDQLLVSQKPPEGILHQHNLFKNDGLGLESYNSINLQLQLENERLKCTLNSERNEREQLRQKNIELESEIDHLKSLIQ